MVEVMSCICIVIAILGYLKYRFLLNPITSMFGLWGIILPFSNNGLYDTIIPKKHFYIIVAIGLLAYLIGGLFGTNKFRVALTSKKKSINNYCINYSIVNILAIITIVYYLIQFSIILRLLLSGYDYGYIRELAVSQDENVLRPSQIFTVIYNFIASPVTYLLIALFPIEVFFGNKKRIFIIECITVMVLFVLTTGGRSVILWIAIYFACILLLYAKKNKFSLLKIVFRYRGIIIIGGIALLCFLLFMTKSRKGDDVDLLQQVFIYFIAPLPHADHYFEVVDQSGIYGYGISSFYGLLYPIFFAFRLIGIFVEYPEFITKIHYMSFEMMESGYYIGGGLYMNAFVTTFYQPYLDGREIGVFVILFLFGYICSKYFTKAYNNFNTKAMLIYILLLQKILFSFVRFYFTQQAQSLCFILAFIVMKPIITDKKENRI